MIYQAYGSFSFGGISLSTYGAFSFYCDTLNRPAREVETVSVPGRNGDLVFDNGRFENVAREYRLQFADIDQLRAFMAAVLRVEGYARLTDTYEPEHFFLARLADAPEVVKQTRNDFSVRVVFERKPQRFLLSGETEKIYSIGSGQTIENPTNYYALPLLKINPQGTSNGTVSIGTNQLQIITSGGAVGTIFVDCDVQDCYAPYTGASRNDKVRLLTGEFPRLAPGQSSISFDSGIQNITIKPRWWTI